MPVPRAPWQLIHANILLQDVISMSLRNDFLHLNSHPPTTQPKKEKKKRKALPSEIEEKQRLGVLNIRQNPHPVPGNRINSGIVWHRVETKR